MIRLHLGKEPAELRTSRKRKLPLAVAAFNAYGAGSTELHAVLRDGYQIAKETLWIRQHGKCAFCEREQDSGTQPVEHFRPKGGAEDFDGTAWTPKTSSHYWWLAWTWSNLFFSCSSCNQTGRKGNRFPIERGQTRITAPVAPIKRVGKIHNAVHSERALLVNPRKDDPFIHLQWAPVNSSQPRHSWQWTIRGLDDRGTITIRALDLQYRVDYVNRHLERMRAGWKAIDRDIAAGQLINARAAWEDLVNDFIHNKRQPFRNAAWWALDALYPKSMRKRLGFSNFAKPRG